MTVHVVVPQEIRECMDLRQLDKVECSHANIPSLCDESGFSPCEINPNLTNVGLSHHMQAQAKVSWLMTSLGQCIPSMSNILLPDMPSEENSMHAADTDVIMQRVLEGLMTDQLNHNAVFVLASHAMQCRGVSAMHLSKCGR